MSLSTPNLCDLLANFFHLQDLKAYYICSQVEGQHLMLNDAELHMMPLHEFTYRYGHGNFI